MKRRLDKRWSINSTASEFDKEAIRYYMSYQDKCTRVHTSSEREVLVKLAGIKEGLSVLDIGSGIGWIAIAAAKRGAKAVGSDLSRKMTDIASQIAKKENADAEFIVDNAENSRLKKNSFDIVITTGAPEFTPNQERFFDGVCSVLKKEGTLVLSFPNKKCIPNKKHIPKLNVDKVRKSKTKTLPDYKQMLEKRGLMIEKVYWYGFNYPDRLLKYWTNPALISLYSYFERWIEKIFNLPLLKSVISNFSVAIAIKARKIK